MSTMSSPLVRWGAGAIAFVALLGILRLRPWQGTKDAGGARRHP